MLAVVHQPLSFSSALSIVAHQFGEIDPSLQEELAHCGVLAICLDREVELWISTDQRSQAPQSKSSLKVLVVIEPPETQQCCTDEFDIILTWQEGHLRKLPNAKLFVSTAPWLLPHEWSCYHGLNKKCALGFLRGAKRRTAGHKLRHDVWNAREDFAGEMLITTSFLEGGVSREERNSQFENMFVLAVENSRHVNYFTEKLLDALLARSVPVYWGCTNLDDFFDTEGIIQTEGGVAEVLQVCQHLTQQDYAIRTAAMDRNFELAKQYSGDFGRRLESVLKNVLPPL